MYSKAMSQTFISSDISSACSTLHGHTYPQTYAVRYMHTWESLKGITARQDNAHST